MSAFTERARRAVESRAKNARSWVWIYALVDSTTLQPRYVGQPRNPQQRHGQHIYGTNSANMREWLRSLECRPLLLLLKRVPPRLAIAAEEWWIDEGKRRGWPLLNVARARPERRTA